MSDLHNAVSTPAVCFLLLQKAFLTMSNKGAVIPINVSLFLLKLCSVSRKSHL